MDQTDYFSKGGFCSEQPTENDFHSSAVPVRSTQYFSSFHILCFAQNCVGSHRSLLLAVLSKKTKRLFLVSRHSGTFSCLRSRYFHKAVWEKRAELPLKEHGHY